MLVACGALACGREPLGPESAALQRVSSVGELYADEDCYSLVVCYRGFLPGEAQAFYAAVNGGGFSPGLSASDRATCENLRTLLNQMRNRGDVGIWTDNWNNWDAVSNWNMGGTAATRGASARSATHSGFENNSFLWFHEVAHVYFDTLDDTVANEWGNKCMRS